MHHSALFMLAWTSKPSISPAVPILAIGILGCCLLFIFLGVLAYIVISDSHH